MPPAAIPFEESSAITSGWALVAAGKYSEAARFSMKLLGQYPRNPAVLSLAVESEIGQSGAAAALGLYEQWLGNRAAEEPGTLRRVARAFLYEWTRQATDSVAQVEALKALAREGDADAVTTLTAGAGAGGPVEARALASLGNAEAVDRIVSRMKTMPGPKSFDIRALGESGSPRAEAALVELLTDHDAENRANAADALGKIGRPDAIPRLQPLLKDPNGAVRVSAAGALYKLGDVSGRVILQELAASPYASVRRSAALLMAAQPDEEWKALGTRARKRFGRRDAPRCRPAPRALQSGVRAPDLR